MDDAFVIGGRGMVGRATMKMFDIPHCYDRNSSNITLKEGAKKLFCFIALPTPTDGRGVQGGMDEIRGFVKQLKQLGGRNIFVIRSTVIPGTCKNLAESLDVMVVMEELGRGLVIEPYLATAILGAGILADVGGQVRADVRRVTDGVG